ncbi:MAG: hypothetical protein EAZ08_10765 [Cytophagales bacterium]|nr:MAG: hypothetical protein EAZ08_10765 [Cytophagales bacterium]
MKKLAFFKVLIVCALFLAASNLSFAQKHDRGNGEKQVQKLKTELQLSDEQVAKVQAATAKRSAQIGSVKEEAKKDRKEKMSKAKAAMDEFDAEMKAVLTPEQYTKFTELKDDRKEKIKERRKNKKGKR